METDSYKMTNEDTRYENEYHMEDFWLGEDCGLRSWKASRTESCQPKEIDIGQN